MTNIAEHYIYAMQDTDNKTNHETVIFCALNKIFGFTPAKVRQAMENGVKPEAIIPPEKRRAGIIGWAEDEIAGCIRQGIETIPLCDGRYPGILKECPDAPLLLYIKGVIPEGTDNAVSVVGTRRPDRYGLETCERIVASLQGTRHPPAIVSGLAYGIDKQAHLSAIRNNGITMAVMATGADRIYPRPHEWVAKAIIDHGGCLISDFPLGSEPLPVHFLRRNRIIAGISKATIVIESPIKGGSMVTASQAFSYGRELYAVPGRIGDRLSEGCNYLIAADMAGCISGTGLFRITPATAQLPYETPVDEAAPRQHPSPGSPDDEAGRLLHAMQGHGPSDTESLRLVTGIPYGRLTALLSEMEIDGKIWMEDGYNWRIKIK